MDTYNYKCFHQLKWLANYTRGQKTTFAAKCRKWSQELGLPVYHEEFEKGHRFNFYHVSVINKLHKLVDKS